MSDSTEITVTTTWTEIPNLVLDSTYAFQNIVNGTMYLRQQAAIPNADDTGFELNASKTAILIKETNSIYVRMSNGNGVAYINELA